jgi:hypothetical protein
VGIESRIESLRPDAARCHARVTGPSGLSAEMELLLVFQFPEDYGSADPEVLKFHAREEYQRLEAPWRPPAACP